VPIFWNFRSNFTHKFRNSPDKLRHPGSDAYSAQQVLLNKQQSLGGVAYLDCYHQFFGFNPFNIDQKDRLANNLQYSKVHVSLSECEIRDKVLKVRNNAVIIFVIKAN